MCRSTFITHIKRPCGSLFLCRLDVIRIKLVDYHYLRHYRDFPDLYTHQTNGICQNFTSDAAVIYPELREQEKTIGTIICLYKSMNRSMHSGSIIFSTKHLRPDVFIGRIIDTTYRLKSKRPVLCPKILSIYNSLSIRAYLIMLISNIALCGAEIPCCIFVCNEVNRIR